jgi:predicted Zn-ribbon and HTH transcriptional regulator
MMNAIEISQEIGIKEKDVYEHLPHVARSVAVQGKNLVILPACCLDCGYVFRDRRRFTRPGRCPKCKGTHIERPAFEIR